MALPALARHLWARLWLRKSQFSGGYGRLKALYAMEDPWQLGSSKEQERFAKTNDLIKQVAPRCRSLLELGCGEGFQTRHLLQVSEAVTGIEVSRQAVDRAKLRCPEASFLVGRAEDAASLVAGAKFDLITAFEVLYYARDIERILADLQQLSPLILVSNYVERAERMAGLFEGPGWRRLENLTAGDTTWRIDLWEATPQSSAG